MRLPSSWWRTTIEPEKHLRVCFAVVAFDLCFVADGASVHTSIGGEEVEPTGTDIPCELDNLICAKVHVVSEETAQSTASTFIGT